jgi:hypothetical protein
MIGFRPSDYCPSAVLVAIANPLVGQALASNLITPDWSTKKSLCPDVSHVVGSPFTAQFSTPQAHPAGRGIAQIAGVVAVKAPPPPAGNW